MTTTRSTEAAPYIKPSLIKTAYDQQQVSTSTGWFVANTDAKNAEATPDDPSTYALGSQAKVKVFATTGRAFIDAALLYVGTDNAAAIDVQAFGFWPAASERDDGAIDPATISASYPALAADNVGGGFWGPLYKPVASGASIQSFALGAPDVNSAAASPAYKLKGGLRWATNGCDRAVILVKTASANPTVALVLARTGS